MPITTRWEPRGFVFAVSGVIASADIHRANARFFEDPRSDIARYQLVDLRACEAIRASEEETETVAIYDLGQSLTTPGVRVAFLVRDSRFDEHIAAYAQTLEGSSWEAQRFTDAAEAMSWARGQVELSQAG